jgi:arylsulfatase A-like enzyme
MLFSNAFVTNSICGPSRAVILTGKHSHRNGFYNNEWGGEFDGSQQTFPKLLQTAGYQTALIGKWHLYSEPTGFDHWSILPDQGQYYNPKFITPAGEVRIPGYVTDVITDQTLEWLSEGRNPGQPFMLMYQHKAPHREWSPGPEQLHLYENVDIAEPPTLFDDHAGRAGALPEVEMSIADDLTNMDLKLNPPFSLNDEQRIPWDAAYGPRNKAFEEAQLEGKDLTRWKYQRYAKDYLRTVASIDDNLGRVLDYLDESGLADNTIVIYSSDQGFFIGEHGWYDKRWMYEESLRIPLVVRWPGQVAPGSRSDALVQNLDFAQTLLDIAGVSAPADMQGRSLKPLLQGGEAGPWRQGIYYQFYENPGWAFVPRHYGIRTRTHKLIHYYRKGIWELFDLESDPDELDNLYGRAGYERLTQELKSQLDQLRQDYGVPDKDPEPTWLEVLKFRAIHFLYSLS